ncbi:hypothetical protein EW145_g1962 [Phellinidium pouzarii]|uniref:Uncharacterized protein n=1 Tax=Phellinidium pouzarii TaxID=167371 RepID=A0A4S4LI27_9AGAM|nr:hypothetical protein EW145_g1962 [Phellinidium pouzarii]
MSIKDARSNLSSSTHNNESSVMVEVEDIVGVDAGLGLAQPFVAQKVIHATLPVFTPTGAILSPSKNVPALIPEASTRDETTPTTSVGQSDIDTTHDKPEFSRQQSAGATQGSLMGFSQVACINDFEAYDTANTTCFNDFEESILRPDIIDKRMTWEDALRIAVGKQPKSQVF